MIFTIGGHPAFACNGEYTDYYLEFEKAEQINSRKKEQFLTGEEYLFLDDEKTVKLMHELFYKGAIILKDMESNWIKLKNKRDNLCIKFTFAGFTHFGIWSAVNDGPYVCLEPWYGVDPTIGDLDEFSKKEGILRLDASGEFNSEYSITINRILD